MIGKSLWMSFTLDRQDLSGIWIWALTCNLLQLILSLIIWLYNFGVKTSCQFVYYYPSYFLLGIFSPFMVSGEVHNEGKIKTMTISPKWTWINFILSVIGSVSGDFAYAVYSGRI